MMVAPHRPVQQVDSRDWEANASLRFVLFVRVMQVPELGRNIATWLRPSARRGEAWMLGLVPVIWRRDWGYRQLSLLYILESDLRCAQWWSARLRYLEERREGLMLLWSGSTGTNPPAFWENVTAGLMPLTELPLREYGPVGQEEVRRRGRGPLLRDDPGRRPQLAFPDTEGWMWDGRW